MSVIIEYTKKAHKGKCTLTESEQAILDVLEEDLRATAGKPYGRGWQSLGPVRQYSDTALHCHLTRKKVVIWEIEEEGDRIKIVLCRFEYVGSRDKAPY